MPSFVHEKTRKEAIASLRVSWVLEQSKISEIPDRIYYLTILLLQNSVYQIKSLLNCCIVNATEKSLRSKQVSLSDA